MSLITNIGTGGLLRKSPANRGLDVLEYANDLNTYGQAITDPNVNPKAGNSNNPYQNVHEISHDIAQTTTDAIQEVLDIGNNIIDGTESIANGIYNFFNTILGGIESALVWVSENLGISLLASAVVGGIVLVVGSVILFKVL